MNEYLKKRLLTEIGSSEKLDRLTATYQTVVILIGNDEPSLKKLCVHGAMSCS